MSNAHVEAAGLRWNRGQSSSSTSPPAARFTPDWGSEDESDLDAGGRDQEDVQTFRLEKPKSSKDEKARESSCFSEKHGPSSSGLGDDCRPQTVRGVGGSTTHGFAPYGPEEERAIVRKFDRHLVLFMALLYMLSFLDRSNIGNVSSSLSTRRCMRIPDIRECRQGLQA